jgi:hypothetical protein
VRYSGNPTIRVGDPNSAYSRPTYLPSSTNNQTIGNTPSYISTSSQRKRLH